MLDVIRTDVESLGLASRIGHLKNWQLTVRSRVKFQAIYCEISSGWNATRVFLSNDQSAIHSVIWNRSLRSVMALTKHGICHTHGRVCTLLTIYWTEPQYNIRVHVVEWRKRRFLTPGFSVHSPFKVLCHDTVSSNISAIPHIYDVQNCTPLSS